ncbi:hypothetical protein TNCV_4082521 [Trichonephila clavipes]|nr:hypothetical protein TNCV_4082521 [Trichonephila clavipes]
MRIGPSQGAALLRLDRSCEGLHWDDIVMFVGVSLVRSQSPELIRIEHAWDALWRAMVTHKPPPRAIQGLKKSC